MKKLFAVLSAMFLLVACGNKADNTSANTTLRVGMECDYAPFNWTQPDANDTSKAIAGGAYCDGYDVVVATKIAEELGLDLEIVKTDWDSLPTKLNLGDIDLIIAGMTDTPEREEVMNFTTPYYESEMVVIVRKDSDLVNLTNIQELGEYNVLGQLGTLYDEIIDQITFTTGSHMTPKEKYPDMVTSLKFAEADALTAELPVAVGITSANDDLTYVTFPAGAGFEVDTSVSIAVAKEKTDLLNKVQAALDSIDADTRVQLMLDATNRQPAAE